jgi:hypothetical protein
VWLCHASFSERPPTHFQAAYGAAMVFRPTHYANGSLKALFRIDHNAPKPFSGCLNQQNCTFYLVAEYHHQANNKWRFEFRTFDI